MRRIRRFALAAVLGLLGASAALAQGTPQPLPAPPGAAQPKTTPAAQPTTPPAAQPTLPPATTHFGGAGPIESAPLGANGCAGGTVGGCATSCAPSCGPKCGTPLLSGLGRTAGRIATAPLIGKGCASPVGCSSFAAERTFLFGSCRQFYNPGNKCGLGGGCGLPHAGPCEYGSYLNR